MLPALVRRGPRFVRPHQTNVINRAPLARSAPMQLSPFAMGWGFLVHQELEVANPGLASPAGQDVR